jgi:hypothetical protein
MLWLERFSCKEMLTPHRMHPCNLLGWNGMGFWRHNRAYFSPMRTVDDDRAGNVACGSCPSRRVPLHVVVRGTRVDDPATNENPGALAGLRLAVEFVAPLYQDLDGPQLETDWTLTTGIQYAGTWWTARGVAAGDREGGDPGRIRTFDPQLRRLLLYPAELRGRLQAWSQNPTIMRAPTRTSLAQSDGSGDADPGLRAAPVAHNPL